MYKEPQYTCHTQLRVVDRTCTITASKTEHSVPRISYRLQKCLSQECRFGRLLHGVYVSGLGSACLALSQIRSKIWRNTNLTSVQGECPSYDPLQTKALIGWLTA